MPAVMSGTFSAGQTLSGSYTFDSRAVDTGAGPFLGVYALGADSLSMTIGGYATGRTGPERVGDDIQVNNVGPDEYQVRLSGLLAGAPVNNLRPTSFFFQLVDASSGVFPSDALPLTLDFSRFSDQPGDTTHWQIIFQSVLTSAIVSGTISNVSVAGSEVQPVPEPATLSLVGFGVLAMARRSRQRSGRP